MKVGTKIKILAGPYTGRFASILSYEGDLEPSQYVNDPPIDHRIYTVNLDGQPYQLRRRHFVKL